MFTKSFATATAALSLVASVNAAVRASASASVSATSSSTASAAATTKTFDASLKTNVVLYYVRIPVHVIRRCIKLTFIRVKDQTKGA